jgi:hypothetical protein
MKQRHVVHRSSKMFLHLYKKVLPEAGVVCRICAKNVEIVRKSCNHMVTRLQQSTHAKSCSGAVNLAMKVSVVYQQKTILSHSAFFERVGVCQSLQAWDPMLGFCPTYRSDSTCGSARGPTPRAPHSVVTSGAWQRPASPTAAPAHD